MSMDSFLEIRKVTIVIKKKDHALRHPYWKHAKTKIMSEIEEVQEQMKTDMEAMKEQMKKMIEAMMDMRKIMEVNVAASTATERNPTHSPIFNQESNLVLGVEGQGGATGVTAYGPKYTKSHNRYIFPPYGLPPNYTPPMVVLVPAENVTNPIPICTENSPT